MLHFSPSIKTANTEIHIIEKRGDVEERGTCRSYRVTIAAAVVAVAAAASAAFAFAAHAAAATSASLLPTTWPVPPQFQQSCSPVPQHSGQRVHLALIGAEKGCHRTARRPRQTAQRRLPGRTRGEEVEEEEVVDVVAIVESAHRQQHSRHGTIRFDCLALTATRMTALVTVDTASVAPPRAKRVPPKPRRALVAGDRSIFFFF